MCINWKVVGGLAAVGVAIFALAPNYVGAALPLLVLAACPISMIFMMKMMSGGNNDKSCAVPDRAENKSHHNESELKSLRAEVDRLTADRHGVSPPTDK